MSSNNNSNKIHFFFKVIFIFSLSIYIPKISCTTSSPIATQDRETYTIYGTLTQKEYENEEVHLSFYDKEAYEGDAAYEMTTELRRNKNLDPFCKKTENVPPKQNNTIRIMSFNVHNFHSVCEKIKPEELRKDPTYASNTINEIAPNIVILEEIVPYATDYTLAKNHNKNGPILVNFSIFDELMQKQGFTHNIKVNDFELHPYIGLNKSFMGKAIYTKKEISLENPVSFRVGNAPTKDRGYIRVAFRHPAQPEELIYIYAVHLSFADPKVTKSEIDDIMKHLKEDHLINKNIIIIGDFNNNPSNNLSVFRSLRLSGYKRLSDNKVTGYNQNPEEGESIDLIYVSQEFLNNFEILNPRSDNPIGTFVTAIESDASDHYPIYLDFRPKNKGLPDKNKEVKPYAKEVKPYASDIIKKIELLKDIKGSQKPSRKKTYTPKPINCKYTQSEAYLKAWYFDKHGQVPDTIDTETIINEWLQALPYKKPEDLSKIKMVANKILETEKKYPDYFVLYNGYSNTSLTHGAQPYTLLYDLYRIISSKFNIISKENPNFRIAGKWPHVLDDINTIKAFVGLVTDHQHNDLTICASPSYFARAQDSADSAISFFVDGFENPTLLNPDTVKLLRLLFDEYQFDEKYFHQLIALHNKYLAHCGGFMMQIFLTKELLDRVAYASIPLGYPFNKFFEEIKVFDIDFTTTGENLLQYPRTSINPSFLSDSFSTLLTTFRNNPLYLYSGKTEEGKSNLDLIDTLQGRIWPTSPDLLDANESQLKIFIYPSDKEVDWQQYRSELNKICDEMLTYWVKEYQNADFYEEMKLKANFYLPGRLGRLIDIMQGKQTDKNFQSYYLNELKKMLTKLGQDKVSFCYWNQEKLGIDELTSCMNILETFYITVEYFSYDYKSLLKNLNPTQAYRIIECAEKFYKALEISLIHPLNDLKKSINEFKKEFELSYSNDLEKIQQQEAALINPDILPSGPDKIYNSKKAFNEAISILQNKTNVIAKNQRLEKLILIALEQTLDTHIKFLCSYIEKSALDKNRKIDLYILIYKTKPSLKKNLLNDIENMETLSEVEKQISEIEQAAEHKRAEKEIYKRGGLMEQEIIKKIDATKAPGSATYLLNLLIASELNSESKQELVKQIYKLCKYQHPLLQLKKYINPRFKEAIETKLNFSKELSEKVITEITAIFSETYPESEF